MNETLVKMTPTDVLEKHGWGLLFGYYPNMDGGAYRIYKNSSIRGNRLLGSGATPDEACLAALAAPVSEFE